MRLRLDGSSEVESASPVKETPISTIENAEIFGILGETWPYKAGMVVSYNTRICLSSLTQTPTDTNMITFCGIVVHISKENELKSGRGKSEVLCEQEVKGIRETNTPCFSVIIFLVARAASMRQVCDYDLESIGGYTESWMPSGHVYREGGQRSITKSIGICKRRCAVWVVAVVADVPTDKKRRKEISCHN